MARFARENFAKKPCPLIKSRAPLIARACLILIMPAQHARGITASKKVFAVFFAITPAFYKSTT